MNYCRPYTLERMETTHDLELSYTFDRYGDLSWSHEPVTFRLSWAEEQEIANWIVGNHDESHGYDWREE